MKKLNYVLITLLGLFIASCGCGKYIERPGKYVEFNKDTYLNYNVKDLDAVHFVLSSQLVLRKTLGSTELRPDGSILALGQGDLVLPTSDTIYCNARGELTPYKEGGFGKKKDVVRNFEGEKEKEEPFKKPTIIFIQKVRSHNGNVYQIPFQFVGGKVQVRYESLINKVYVVKTGPGKKKKFSQADITYFTQQVEQTYTLPEYIWIAFSTTQGEKSFRFKLNLDDGLWYFAPLKDKKGNYIVRQGQYVTQALGEEDYYMVDRGSILAHIKLIRLQQLLKPIKAISK